MAPSPVLNIEPKGPDKNDEKCIESVPPKDKQNMPKSVNDNVTSKEKISVDQLRLDEIEDAGLKSLLDEAYSYKSPKDRLGKSNLFQVLLNEVEENDAGKKKKLSERSNSFADGRSNASASAVGNGHDTAQDKAFLNNILGACEKDKKKKNKKRDGSSASSGSRRPKFSHSLKINHGPQSSSHAYNGSNTGSATNVYNGGSRSLSRVQQPFASRISNTKTAALLTTSSSNIDIPMVTTYNKQPIMTPALVPSTQKSSPDVITLESSDENGKSVADDTGTAAAIALSPKSPAGEKELDAIEMKILESKGGDRGSVFNYTTHASLEIGNGGAVDGGAKPGDDYDKEDAENVAPTVVFPFQQSLGGLMNGNSADRSSTRCSTTDCPKSVNGLSDSEKLEDADNAVSSSNNNTVMKHVENEEDEDAKKNGHHHHQHDVHNDEKQTPRSDYINDNNVGASLYAASVDEPKTLTSLLAKSAAAQNSANNSAFKYHAEPSYSPYPWHVPNLIVTLTGADSMAATLGRNYCTKESLESRRLCDENTNTLNSSYPYFGNNSTSMNRERLDNGSERKHKSRKPKKQNTTSVLAENIEGYCGDKSVEYLVDYIENTKPGGEGGPKGGSVKSGKPSTSATRSSAGAKNNSRASTDDEVRSKKPNKTKERLKKSTSLEDLRHNKSHKQAPNKKQSSMDDSDLAKTMSDEVAPADTPERRSNETKTLSDDSSHLYYDSVDHVDDDNYTETDFHLVTKKQRKKKRRSKSRSATLEQKGSLSQNFLPHNYTDRNDNGNFKRSTRSTENRHRSRRKSVSSVVPSDKISDSDSIHSLPVSSTTPKCKMKKKSTSSGCTPQASYADIAKSPQCSSSTTLNGDAGKWHSSLKTFSNSPPSAYSTTTQNTTASSFGSSTSASSSNTGDTPEHSDNSELVSGAVVRSRKSDHSNVGSDHSCDQLSFANDDNSFNEHPPPSVHSSVDCVDEKDSGCSVNDSSAGSASTECGIEVTLKRKPNKSSGGGKNAENDTNNNTPNANLSNGVDNKTPKDYHSNASSNSSTVCNNSTNSHNVNHNNSSNIINNINNNINNNNNNNNINNNNNNNINNNNNNNNNTNANATKIKKSRNKKNKNINNNVDDNDINDNHDVNCCKNDKAMKNVADGVGEELFIEFTLKCAPAATTKSSETQTDSETVEVNNNACNRYHHRNNSNGCNDVTVEQTIVLSCNRSNGVAFDGSQSQTSVDKLSHSLPINNETGKTVLLLNDNNSPNNSAPSEINVEFDATEQSLEDATKERQSEIQKEIVERSAKYNVTEVIQYVNKNWNEVVKNLASSKVANANKKVQYYAGK